MAKGGVSMAEFIIVHEKGEERIVNLSWVEQVWPDENHTFIHFAFQGRDCCEPDYIVADESFDEIKKMIMGGDNG